MQPVARAKSAPLTLDSVIAATARQFRLTPSDLVSRQRHKLVSTARQVAMYLAREETTTSLQQIGEAFGGRDHTTVIHACTRINENIAADHALARQIAAIRDRLVSTVSQDDERLLNP